ncbi:hypothetical protein HPB48_000385 [Haemaphysalis longicornis]|uniref:Uncharacterized protein n=1 Tax=Haemaphysalis longicornis TaxID=44386 RepID=A0A9J6GP24_HAELO|nr:hypothetical protein HPB48_000385 [Haemaphysalis longicornis]
MTTTPNEMRPGRADEDLEDWIRLYERYAAAEEARRWYSSVLRETSATRPLGDVAAVAGSSPRGFAGENVQDWAYIQLQERRQQLTHVGAMAQHAMAAMPTHALPGFVASSPFWEERDHRDRRGPAAEHCNREADNKRPRSPDT